MAGAIQEQLTEITDGHIHEVQKWYWRKEKDASVGEEEIASLVALLKVCAKQKDLFRGSRIHVDIRRRGLLGKNVCLGNTLVDLYAKCGALAKALEVFNELRVRDKVSWNVLIAGYARHRQGKEAWNCFQRMQREGFSPDTVTFVCVLKACGSMQAVDLGREIHAEIVREGLLGQNLYVGNALLDMYTKCGAFEKAEEVFDELQVRSVVSWTALITGYVQHGHGEKALDFLERMQLEGLLPNGFTYVCILKACGSIGAAYKGKGLHAKIVKEGLLENDIMVGNALVDMYVKLNELKKAKEVFDELQVQDVVSWTVLIGGYAQMGFDEEALHFFEQMQCEGLCPNSVTFLCVLKACGNIGAVEKGKAIHAEIVRKGLLEKNMLVGNASVDMYARFGALEIAKSLFDELWFRDITSWTVLVSGYAQHGHNQEALNCFEQMQHELCTPNIATFVCILKACGSLGAVDKGKQIHTDIVRQGLLEQDTLVGNALVDMYAKCGTLKEAQEVFDELQVRDVVSWTALIAGYAQQGHAEEALNYFEQMQREGFSADAVTFVCLLKACGSVGAADKGTRVHAEIVKERWLGKDALVGNALVCMYAKCGVLDKAQEVFNELRVKDVVSWTSLIAGYVQHGHGEEALNCFEQLRQEDHPLDALTYVCILKACGSVGAAETGVNIHAEIVTKGFLEKEILVGNALVDMYAKCGLLDKAQEVFNELQVRDVVCWNALIAGYAQHGLSEEAINCFDQMQCKGLPPDGSTFIILLNACSHSGLLEKGQTYFETIRKGYGITPTLEHYACVVDLFGRAGHFDKAVALIKKMPSSDYHPVWTALLGACQKWGNLKLARLAFDRAVQLDEWDGAAYACMSNIYAAAAMQGDADKVAAMRVERQHGRSQVVLN